MNKTQEKRILLEYVAEETAKLALPEGYFYFRCDETNDTGSPLGVPFAEVSDWLITQNIKPQYLSWDGSVWKAQSEDICLNCASATTECITNGMSGTCPQFQKKI